MRPRREREASLAVAASDPGRIADSIAAVREVAGFRLEALPERDLHDVYLDRPDHDLRRAGLALRLRRTGEDPPLLAVKGDERRLPGGGVDRLEQEARWGEGALSEAATALADAGLPAGLLPEEAGRGGALERLRGHGWRVVQERRTRRRPRRLSGADGDGEAGELAVDEVRYRVGARRAIHREVELEAAPGRNLPAGVLGALRRRFGNALRPWDHSKLATGRALERLEADGGAGEWRRPDGSLTPTAYDLLAGLLEEEG